MEAEPSLDAWDYIKANRNNDRAVSLPETYVSNTVLCAAELVPLQPTCCTCETFNCIRHDMRGAAQHPARSRRHAVPQSMWELSQALKQLRVTPPHNPCCRQRNTGNLW